MAWTEVDIKVGNKAMSAMQRGDEISILGNVKIGDSITLAGKKVPVESSDVDPRGETTIIRIAAVAARSKSDDEPDEGSG